MDETNKKWSAAEFIKKTITRENGFTATLIDAVEEVVLQAERAQKLEVWEETARNLFGENVSLKEENKQLKASVQEKHDGFMATVDETVELAQEIKRFREALLKIAAGDTWVAHAHDIAKWALDEN